MSTKIEIQQATIEDMFALLQQIPEMNPPDNIGVLNQRLENRQVLGLIALVDGNALGFKLGYTAESSCFYSWLGGVVPEARGRGVARALLQAQEYWVQQQGFAEIRVKSMNRYRNMLQMLLAHGYEIAGVEHGSSEAGDLDDLKILFSKRFSRPAI